MRWGEGGRGEGGGEGRERERGGERKEGKRSRREKNKNLVSELNRTPHLSAMIKLHTYLHS